MRLPRRPGLALALLVLAAASAASAAPPEADPFYLGLLREGRAAYARKDLRSAATDLRLACFGLLDHPPLLGECLIRLSLAQAALSDGAGFRASFDRLLELEDRFQIFEAVTAALPAEIRAEFEQQALALLDPATVAGFPPLAELGLSREIDRVRRLPERERQRELERHLKVEPGETRWRLLAAELDLSRRRYHEVLTRLEGVGSGPQGEAACLRSAALAGLDRCAEALAERSQCGRSDQESNWTRLVADCQPAEKVATKGGAEVPKSRKRSTGRRSAEATASPLPQGHGAGSTAVAPPASEPIAAVPAPTPESPAVAESVLPAVEPTGAVPPALSGADQRRVEQARRLLAGARQAEDLEAALTAAREVADRYPGRPDLQHLTAEIAYRASRWALAAEYFLRGGDPGPAQPALQFYMAVALYEAGARQEAARILANCLPRLDRSPFVEAYRQKILGGKP